MTHRRRTCTPAARGVPYWAWGGAPADIAFDGDRELYRRPAIFLQRRSVGLHQRHYLGEAAGVDDEPCITNPRRTPHRHVGLPGDIERRSARANWLHTETGIVDCV